MKAPVMILPRSSVEQQYRGGNVRIITLTDFTLSFLPTFITQTWQIRYHYSNTCSRVLLRFPSLFLETVATIRRTTNDAYEADDIQSISSWQEFNVNRILQDQPTMNSETHLRLRSAEYLVPRIRPALRAAFSHLESTNLLNGRTPVSFDAGESAATIATFKPDIAYYDILRAGANGPSRAPGDLKPSWKWTSAWRTDTPYNQHEYRQALSQVNWYLHQHNASYGVIMTNMELAVRRVDDNGNLQLSNPIPWEARGTSDHPHLTVLLALWYLGMLASQNQGPDRWNM